ncbi:elongation factor P maturation arginine rhamnosyltransferase EarP [Craterilacuibacter sinensis]|uniref:Protein-arginine rhamnosyltransferase n=1 Tax=Craterilacuibacter sinensis TaxID=2686017 RepID=A0A845BR06_9NEIS|nr:elongation factor P maturation arginine rhamnosyltransferase EarP [Craterilacuibacter sinensis]MXR36666.1 elongation factor P maturation arginine rhamnosyltransferase EarP [Craterilacuibacter sinensis]
MKRQQWDVFCNVIDNYGDIGIAWRLAHQIAHEYGQTVRLWVDDMQSFARIEPMLDATQAQQMLEGVEIRHWPRAFPHKVDAADIVIEAFGCTLPEPYVTAMAARSRKPVWVNLEYLSAEDWIEGCHALPSPHPRLALTKWFFFPGFSEQSGGLICEAGLFARRDAWQADLAGQQAYWHSLGLAPRQSGELIVSLFTYESPAVGDWLQACAMGAQAVRVMVPHGRVIADVARLFGRDTLMAGETLSLGSLTVHVLPFSEQSEYDKLLWSCDFNIVRGEDSFMRAQWAARPFLWHIYPQDEDAHIVKLDAFLQRYSQSLSTPARQALTNCAHGWNRGTGMADAWMALQEYLPELAGHARIWPQQALGRSSLAARLVQMIEKQLQ